MSPAEARHIGSIACTADGECISCANALIRQLIVAFPAHTETFRACFKHAFDQELEEQE